jgi:hypothetical protein
MLREALTRGEPLIVEELPSRTQLRLDIYRRHRGGGAWVRRQTVRLIEPQ